MSRRRDSVRGLANWLRFRAGVPGPPRRGQRSVGPVDVLLPVLACHVRLEVGPLGGGIGAEATRKRSFSGVGPNMPLEVVRLVEALAAHGAVPAVPGGPHQHGSHLQEGHQGRHTRRGRTGTATGFPLQQMTRITHASFVRTLTTKLATPGHQRTGDEGMRPPQAGSRRLAQSGPEKSFQRANFAAKHRFGTGAGTATPNTPLGGAVPMGCTTPTHSGEGQLDPGEQQRHTG